jgi:hypothetical protein
MTPYDGPGRRATLLPEGWIIGAQGAGFGARAIG